MAAPNSQEPGADPLLRRPPHDPGSDVDQPSPGTFDSKAVKRLLQPQGRGLLSSSPCGGADVGWLDPARRHAAHVGQVMRDPFMAINAGTLAGNQVLAMDRGRA